jgi:hypothetical protein
VENNHPNLFSQIRDLIKKDKIEIASGQYLLADTMIPHGEVLIREITEGKKYLKNKFAEDVVVGWWADEFEFNAQWPQILRESGYRFFAIASAALSIGRSLSTETRGADIISVAGFLLGRLSFAHGCRVRSRSVSMPTGLPLP